MSSIRFVSVPHEKREGLPQIVKLDSRALDGIVPGNLLDEAIRFYNYPLEKRYCKDRPGWPAFSKKHLEKAIPSLHEVFRQRIVGMVRNLYGSIPEHINKKTWDNYKNKKVHSKRGVMCAKLLVSDECRKENVKPPVYFRKFEKLIPQLRDLETLVRQVERTYNDQYSEQIGSSETMQDLFNPWGGSWVVKPKKQAGMGGSSDESWNSGELEQFITQKLEHQVGTTEKLYFTLMSDVFEKLHKNNLPKSVAETKDDFLKAIYRQSTAIWKLFPLDEKDNKKIKIWRQWQRNLEHLAYIFETAISSPWRDAKSKQRIDEAWVEKQYADYATWEKENTKQCGIRLGFPAALGLIGILYAYITSLMARTLMGALSSAIIDIYEEINGYTAVSLHRELTQGKLKAWRNFKHVRVDWADSKIEQDASKILKGLLNKPLISKARWRKTPSYKKQTKNIGEEGLSFEAFYETYIPRFPVITKQFYENLHGVARQGLLGQKKTKLKELIKKWYKDEKLYGATFESQVHIFVAFQLLEKSKEILEWDWKSGKENKDWKSSWENKEYFFREKRKILNKKRLPCFFIAAGSFVFGGRKLPHMTHRHGVNFDFIFGPDLISWPVSSISDYIVVCKRDKKCKQALKRFSADSTASKKFLTKIWRPRAYVICYTKKQEGKKSASRVNRPPMVFRVPIRDRLVNVCLSDVRRYCNAEKTKSVPYYSEKEKDVYTHVESRLLGTPHFMSPEDALSLGIRAEECTELADWQRTHAGHLSILLSAPSQIIYASPIVHFRALHAIRQALKEEGLFVFGFECFDEYVDYLNNPLEYFFEHNRSIPEKLLETFYSNGIPLDLPHKIEKKDSDWILENYGSRFRLRTQDNYINVYYLSNDDLVADFSRLIVSTRFTFMPDNHHHHWHVDYASDKLETYKELWLALGVDLEGFNNYLGSYQIDNEDPLLKMANKEQSKTNVSEWIRAYMGNFNEMYGEDENKCSDEQRQNRTIARRLSEVIFGVYKSADSPFIKPAVTLDKGSQSNQINIKATTSGELKELIEFSEKLIYGKNGLVSLFSSKMKKNQEMSQFIHWSIHYILEHEPREHEPLDLRRLLEEEPELEDYEPVTELIV